MFGNDNKLSLPPVRVFGRIAQSTGRYNKHLVGIPKGACGSGGNCGESREKSADREAGPYPYQSNQKSGLTRPCRGPKSPDERKRMWFVTEKIMQTFEQYNLIKQKRWKEFLSSLENGEHTFLFPSVPDIKSCKSVAYTMNTDELGRIYSFVVDKHEKRIEITVRQT